MLSFSEIGNANKVEHIEFHADFHVFLASILNSVCFTVPYQLSSWSTQLLRKVAFVFKVYQSVHSVCLYVSTDQDFQGFTSLSSFT